ncbi:Serine carboxypeptidase-like, partial [Trema orientale]
YVGVGEYEDIQLFYYFAKSERYPEKDPLVLWLCGGPGCSGWSGFAYEIGALRFSKVEHDKGSSLPTLVLNPYSWTKVSSIIFIDSPVGAGFSYGRTPLTSQTGVLKQVQHMLQFLRKWLADHPSFISHPVYLAGSSYSGIPIPVLAQQISNENEGGVIPYINLQGYILGNPVTDPSDDNYEIPFAHGMALISDELYKSLEKNCEGQYKKVDPSNADCLKDMQAFEKSVSGIHFLNILSPFCNIEALDSDEITDGRRSLSVSEESEASLYAESANCQEIEHVYSRYWANDASVRKALGVREGTIGKWKRCKFNIPYEHDVRSSIQFHLNLSSKGYRSLIYSGDHDMRVSFLATQAWITSLNFSIIDDWRSWILQGQIAG